MFVQRKYNKTGDVRVDAIVQKSCGNSKDTVLKNKFHMETYTKQDQEKGICTGECTFTPRYQIVCADKLLEQVYCFEDVSKSDETDYVFHISPLDD